MAVAKSISCHPEGAFVATEWSRTRPGRDTCTSLTQPVRDCVAQVQVCFGATSAPHAVPKAVSLREHDMTSLSMIQVKSGGCFCRPGGFLGMQLRTEAASGHAQGDLAAQRNDDQHKQCGDIG